MRNRIKCKVGLKNLKRKKYIGFNQKKKNLTLIHLCQLGIKLSLEDKWKVSTGFFA